MKKEFNKLTVMGLGYIGLPTAAVFAARKIQVCGVDVNKSAVETINRGEIHIVEPELDMVVHATVSEGYLKASLSPEPADAFIIAVPTPFKEGNDPDLSYIEAATKAIAPVLKKGDLVVLESTSPVGATEHMAKGIAEFRKDLRIPTENRSTGNFDIFIAHCPERVLPGQVMRELVENDRIIGGMTQDCAEKAKELYEVFVHGDCLLTDVRTAEMAKLTENAFRDVNIAFANELSMIADKLDIDVWELISLANKHPRVDILQPGCGVGGHCIAVDPWFIVSKTPDLARITRMAREVNDAKPEWVLKKVDEMLTNISAKSSDENTVVSKVACYGLAFKPDIDDLRESPALGITTTLAKKYPESVMVVEPNISEVPHSLKGKVTLVDFDYALKNADINVILVDHKEFIKSADRLRQVSNIIDTRGIL
ncbi:UDP-N-acetyl-D-mannosamine dehydrogenase [Microbulbifer sp. DLAB2-AF]|uniref:UDP-N-acetyl-D-mannosamine dehydrogenase n=1 Tax=Microbulbifer sp. DLAB2-AF TaxID=3243395 RepID=UPI00403975AF